MVEEMTEKRIVKIEFLNHVQVSDAKLEDLKETKPVRCTVYGELLVDGPDYIVVLSLFEEKVENADPQNFGICILKGAITHIEDLTSKEGEKNA